MFHPGLFLGFFGKWDNFQKIPNLQKNSNPFKKHPVPLKNTKTL